MNSLILRTAARYLFPVMLLFSIYALLRGHNDPGGGFVGGLAAASAYTLYALAYSAREARQLLKVDSVSLVGWGLLIALGSGIYSIVQGKPFLTGTWGTIDLGLAGSIKLGTPLIFDIGVYLVVLGVTLTIILALSSEEMESP